MLLFGLGLSILSRRRNAAPRAAVDASGSVAISGARPSATVELLVTLLSAPTVTIDTAGSAAVSSATASANIELSVT